MICAKARLTFSSSGSRRRYSFAGRAASSRFAGGAQSAGAFGIDVLSLQHPDDIPGGPSSVRKHIGRVFAREPMEPETALSIELCRGNFGKAYQLDPFCQPQKLQRPNAPPIEVDLVPCKSVTRCGWVRMMVVV